MTDFVKLAERASAESLALRTSFLEGDTTDVLENRRNFVSERLEELRQRSADSEGVSAGSSEQHGEAPKT